MQILLLQTTLLKMLLCFARHTRRERYIIVHILQQCILKSTYPSAMHFSAASFQVPMLKSRHRPTYCFLINIMDYFSSSSFFYIKKYVEIFTKKKKSFIVDPFFKKGILQNGGLGFVRSFFKCKSAYECYVSI